MTGEPVIVVAGSLHYDIMVAAPDRPRKGETVTGHSWHPKFGGKGGNQALAAAAAGARVRMVGAVGDDAFGRFLTDTLDAHGIDATRVSRIAGAGSGMSVAISDSEGDYGAVIVSGANLLTDPAVLNDTRLWEDAGALILQNEAPDAINIAAARAAKRAGVMVCLNAAPYRALPADLVAAVDVLIVNTIEAEQLSGLAVADLASAEAAAEALAKTYGCAVVTAGGDGVVGQRQGETPVVRRALPVTVQSTHGAGDVFVGTLVAALAKGRSFEQSLDAANAAAARHVSGKPAAEPYVP